MMICLALLSYLCDNLGVAALASNLVFHARTKHVEIDLHFIRDMVLQQRLEIRYVSTEDQIADLFTKSLSVARFLKLKHKLHVTYARLA